MVEVKYAGRLGNNLFQYCLGRIIAEQLGYRLKADPIPHFPNTKTFVNGEDNSSYPPQIFRGQVINLKNILQEKTKRKIILDGYFQNYEYYKEYKDVIKKNWLLMDVKIEDRITPDDIVVCFRRSDYVPQDSLPMSYYLKALSMAKYNRVFICTDDVNDPFVRSFRDKYNAIVHHTDTAMDDFVFTMLFNKIVIANSTFFWWASFLSNAQKIYFPIPVRGTWSGEYPDRNLKVDDEARYNYIICRENLFERLGYLQARAKFRIKSIARRLAASVKL